MKKYLLLLPLCLLILSCDSPAKITFRKASIIKQFGESCEIQNLPNSFTEFIVRNKDGNVWYVVCGSLSNNILEIYQLFPDPALAVFKTLK